MFCQLVWSRWSCIVTLVVLTDSAARSASITDRSTRSALHNDVNNTQTVLTAAVVGSSGGLQELAQNTQRTPLVRRQHKGSAYRHQQDPDAPPEDDGTTPPDDSEDVDIIPHPLESAPAVPFGTDSQAKEDLKELLVCPPDWGVKKNMNNGIFDFSGGNKMCRDEDKMEGPNQTENCDWSEKDKHIGNVCNMSCFCEAYDVRKQMTVDMCASMCADRSKCWFIYTSSNGCRLYRDCESFESPDYSGDKQDKPHDWVTCERFMEKQDGKYVALHNALYNRYIMIAKDTGPPPSPSVPNTTNKSNSKLMRTYYEVDVKKTENTIAQSMRFMFLNTSDGRVKNVLNKGSEDATEVANKEGEGEGEGGGEGGASLVVGAYGEGEGEAAGGGEGDGDGDGGGDDEGDTVGGPNQWALYINVMGDEKPWIVMIEDENRPLDGPMLQGSKKVTEQGIFTIVWMGPNEIAIHNKAENRYVAMTDKGVGASPKQNCCTLKDEWKLETSIWFGRLNFTMVTPPALTGYEDTSNDDWAKETTQNSTNEAPSVEEDAEGDGESDASGEGEAEGEGEGESDGEGEGEGEE